MQGGCRPALFIYSTVVYPSTCLATRKFKRDYSPDTQTGILFDFTSDGSPGVRVQVRRARSPARPRSL